MGKGIGVISFDCHAVKYHKYFTQIDILGVLIHGPSSCGKTSLACWLAQEGRKHFKLISVACADLVHKVSELCKLIHILYFTPLFYASPYSSFRIYLWQPQCPSMCNFSSFNFIAIIEQVVGESEKKLSEVFAAGRRFLCCFLVHGSHAHIAYYIGLK